MSFGTVPVLNGRGYSFEEGPVHLLRGDRAFGARHIFLRHAKEMAQRGFLTENEVSGFVQTILKPWAPLHLEGEAGRTEKLAVVQSSSGTVVLGKRQDFSGAIFYSVITAYLGHKRHGMRIGKLL